MELGLWRKTILKLCLYNSSGGSVVEGLRNPQERRPMLYTHTTYSVGFVLFQAIKLNLTKIHGISNTLHISPHTDGQVNRQTYGQTDWKTSRQARHIASAHYPLASAEERVICRGFTSTFHPLDVTWITTLRLPSALWDSTALPLKRLCVIKIETAKKLGK